ncbi:hypothetical protein [Rhizobium sp. R693]|uniref:hypothetical protein n=1 Tax=Rhizobium sp. R693 TaxID=1764276 RepID=UPI000B533703|nr:hypothetical protein [Rhizobium sp. R693]OWV94149.1 hypothetical protein ATY79_26760 [Rhizobium sp. R693]
MYKDRTVQDWYEVGKRQGVRAGRLGGEVQRHQYDFDDEEENADWIDGVLEGVLSVGARIAAVKSVQDLISGSKGGLIQVILVERRWTSSYRECPVCCRSAP